MGTPGKIRFGRLRIPPHQDVHIGTNESSCGWARETAGIPPCRRASEKCSNQQLLLSRHAGRAAGPRPNRAKRLQILVRLGAVEGDLAPVSASRRPLPGRRPGGRDSRNTPMPRPPSRRRRPPGRRDKRVAGKPRGRRCQGSVFMASFGPSISATQAEATKFRVFPSCPKPLLSGILPPGSS